MIRDLWTALTRWKWEWEEPGGFLVDRDRWYAARDKVQHAACAFLLWLLLALPPLGLGQRFALFALGAAGVELVEGYRLARHERRSAAGLVSYARWPAFADEADAADLAADALGLACAFLYLLLLRGAG